MDNKDSKVNPVHYKALFLPGSFQTYFISISLFAGTCLLLVLFIYVVLTKPGDVELMINELGPIIFFGLVGSYLFFSYRIVISRHEDTLIVYRQFIGPQIQFLRREYPINSLNADEVTYAGGEDSGPTTYTTLFSKEQIITKYSGKKKKLRHVLPELLMPKIESSGDDDTMKQQFWSDVSGDS